MTHIPEEFCFLQPSAFIMIRILVREATGFVQSYIVTYMYALAHKKVFLYFSQFWSKKLFFEAYIYNFHIYLATLIKFGSMKKKLSKTAQSTFPPQKKVQDSFEFL